MSSEATALVGLGANLGDPLANLRDAVERLGSGAARETTVIGASAVYESIAVGAPGPNYLNAAIVLDTALMPAALLAELRAMEAAMGRVRRERWGPRVIDLDLLAWIPQGETQSVVLTGDVELPHPRITGRDFVLVPLLDVWPGLVVAGRSLAAHLEALAQEQRAIVRCVGPLL